MTRKEQKITQVLALLADAQGLLDGSPKARAAVREAEGAVARVRRASKGRKGAPAFMNFIRVAIVDDIGAEFRVEELTDNGRHMARYAAEQLIEEIDDYREEQDRVPVTCGSCAAEMSQLADSDRYECPRCGRAEEA